MFETYWYLVLLAVLLLFALALLPFRRGRRFLIGALPALALFLVLLGTAEAAFQFGVARGKQGEVDETVYTCSMHPSYRQRGPGLCPVCHMNLEPLEGLTSGPLVSIDPVVVQNMGVRVGPVVRGPLRHSLRAFAALQPAQSRLYDVALKVDGFVERLFADTEGMAIDKGQPLFELYSPALIVAVEELIAARQSGDERLLAAARQKLALWDLAAASIDALAARESAPRTIAWPSPVAGVLLQKNVVEGAPAAPGQVLLRLADLSLLWLDAQVAEADLPTVQVGQWATATLPALPGEPLRGKVVFVAPTLDPVTRTGTVRIELPNADGRLKPGMFAQLQLERRLADDAVLVPQEAVLDSGERQLAWIAVGKGKFEPRPLRLGRHGDGGVVEVLDGLAAGDQVVLSGQFLIDAESRLREGTRKLGEQGLMVEGDLPAPEPLPLSPATQQQVDALLAAYLETAAAFVQDQHHADDWQHMVDAALQLSTAQEPEVQLPANELAAALQQNQQGLVQMRVAFKQVSALLLKLFERARPRGPGRLYVVHCPMVDADWLQRDQAVKNPYDPSMLSCGSVVRSLPLREAGK